MKFRLGIDVGGTFTDFLLVDETGEAKVYKTLSTPQDPTIGFFNGLTDMSKDYGLELNEFVQQIELIVHGTTVGTNAALTYTGAKTALLTTKGFRDVLQMRRGIRPDAYNNRYVPPAAYTPRYMRLGVEERVDLQGQEVTPINEAQVLELIQFLKEEQVEAVAVSFMHSYANDKHEQLAGELLQQHLPEAYITLSSELIPRAGLYDRTSTTVLNSYVGPIIKNYLTRLTDKLRDSDFKGTLLIMQSNGGVATPSVTMEQAANTLLSGPASAPVAGGWYLKPIDLYDAITMDMGGTSFDVSLVKDGMPVIRSEGEIAEWPINLSTVDIHTIGSGGGSIAWVDDGGLLHVGPKSAGANPGPASYGFGGEYPTVTDANLVLGYLNPEYFLGGKMKLYPEKAKQAIKEHVADKLGIGVQEAAQGIIDMVNVSMANGIRQITVNRGFDPREFPLVCAGGAGPLHANAIAEELESTMVIIPKESSIFCAAGMLMSDLRHDYVKSYRALMADLNMEEVQRFFEELKAPGISTLNGEGIATENIRFQYSLDMMYAGQYFEVSVAFTEEEISSSTIADLERRFHEQHEQLFGYSTKEMPVEVINFHLSAIGVTEKPVNPHLAFQGEDASHAFKGKRLASNGNKGELQETAVYDGDRLVHGNHLEGPAIIEQTVTTIIVKPEFNIFVDKNDNFIMYNKTLGKESMSQYIAESEGVVHE